MPAPSASTPFLPNLNQHVNLEPLEGPLILEVRLDHPTDLFLIPRNREELKFEEEEICDLEEFEMMGW